MTVPMNYVESPWYILYSIVMGILMSAMSYLIGYAVLQILFIFLGVFHFVFALYLIYKKVFKEAGR